MQHQTHNTFKKQLCQRLGRPDPPNYFNMANKWGNILHARLRMNMTSLNSHLFIIQKVPSTECRCGHANENISHFILNCTYYDEQRHTLFDNISQTLQIDFRNILPQHQLRTLLNGLDVNDEHSMAVASQFQNFLLNTKRFNQYWSDLVSISLLSTALSLGTLRGSCADGVIALCHGGGHSHILMLAFCLCSYRHGALIQASAFAPVWFMFVLFDLYMLC